MNNKWTVEYNNDVGPEDDYLIEWYEVTNKDMIFKCDEYDHALWLCAQLNDHKEE